MTAPAPWQAAAGRLTAALHLDVAPIAITFSRARRRRAAVRRPARADARADPGRPHRPGAGRVRVLGARRSTARSRRRRGPRQLQRRQPHPRAHRPRRRRRNAPTSARSSRPGWVTPDVVPAASRRSTSRPAAITYGPLADAPVDPDVVLVRHQRRAADDDYRRRACPTCVIEGKPQCHIVAIAKEQNRAGGQRRLRAQPRPHRDGRATR